MRSSSRKIDSLKNSFPGKGRKSEGKGIIKPGLREKANADGQPLEANRKFGRGSEADSFHGTPTNCLPPILLLMMERRSNESEGCWWKAGWSRKEDALEVFARETASCEVEDEVEDGASWFV